MTTNLTNKNTFEIIKFLLTNEISKDEILNTLNIKAPTFYKHLKLIKRAGFEIERNDDIYKIKLFKNVVHLGEHEKSLIAYLIHISSNYLSENNVSIIKKSIEKMLNLCTSNDYQKVFDNLVKIKIAFNEKEFNEKIKTLKQYTKTNTVIKITLSNGKNIKVLPLDFCWEKEKLFLNCISGITGKQKTISIKKIVKISATEKRVRKIKANETIFELYGRLANIYLLKENERIIDNFKDKLVIANYEENKNLLFRRLLRYDTMCKVIFPKKDSEKFLQLINTSLDNLDKFQDNNI